MVSIWINNHLPAVINVYDDATMLNVRAISLVSNGLADCKRDNEFRSVKDDGIPDSHDGGVLVNDSQCAHSYQSVDVSDLVHCAVKGIVLPDFVISNEGNDEIAVNFHCDNLVNTKFDVLKGDNMTVDFSQNFQGNVSTNGDDHSFVQSV